MKIQILSPEVASQIAAGEVVERPASVVKELVENALDAGGRALTVTIQEAGRKLVEVADDGAGISADELTLAVERHATSKLQNANDLFKIGTLGFRGEALASIGSVSRMTLTSRRVASDSGARIRVEAGIAGPVEPVGAPVGTVVRVEDLFFNVPARLKFLRKDVTERRAIDEILSRYALAYPDVRFRFTSNDSPVLQTSGDGDRRAILASLYGVEVARQMLEVLAEEEMETGQPLRLTGYISPASLTRSNRKEITFFINGRWVSDTPLNQAIVQAYHTLLMVGRFPLTTLFLEIDPAQVDVNVHPAKAEVRFQAQDKIFSFVQRSVRRALLAYSPVPSMPPAQNLWGSSSVAGGNQYPVSSGQYPAGGGQGVGLEWGIAHEEMNEEGRMQNNAEGRMKNEEFSTAPQSDLQPSTFNLPLLRLVGQIGASYLVAEGPDGLYLIDQHAAHERILFEKLMNQRASQNIASQALLTPEVVSLPPASASLIQEQLPVLQKFGFEIEPFGPGAFQVRAMPVLFSGSDPAAALRALVEDFEEDEAPLQDEIEAKVAGRVCKRLAVKAGQALSPEEQRALLENLEACESPRTCPHGRPTMIHLSVDVLERQFGRRGAR